MNTIEIEYKVRDNGSVVLFFKYDEKANDWAKRNGGSFTKFSSGRKGWILPTMEAFEEAKANLYRWGWAAEYTDGNAPKPEPESQPITSIYSLPSLDGEHRAAFVADALGY